MDDPLLALADQQGGVFTRAQALACGYSVERVRRNVRAGAWRRLRSGAYAPAAVYYSCDEVGRHALLVHAVMLTLRRRPVVSHTSAIVLHDLPLWGIDLTRVHVTRGGRCGGRVEAGVVHHRSLLVPDDVTERQGWPITVPARAVIETARISSFEAGVVIADSALHTGLTDIDELQAALDQARSWPDSCSASLVIAFADGRAESPGESRARVLFMREGLPAPELQVPVSLTSGAMVRVDFMYPEHNTIVEFDGMTKYGLDRRSSGHDLFREKRREDALRELGYEVVRMVWADFSTPGAVANRIKRAFDRARRPPNRPSG